MKSAIAALGFVVFGLLFAAGCGKSGEHESMERSNTERKIDSTNIRTADIDVATLDINKDDKVYQCPMHNNVISDEVTTCPVCMMNLEEVSVQDAQANLHNKTNH